MYWYLRTLIKLFLGKGVHKSYSQFGEDMAIQPYVRNINKGIYVDVGCYDPVLYSNTYHYYKKGWSGIVIDPNQSLAAKYRWMRPRDTFVCAGIGTGEMAYSQFKDGAFNKFFEGNGAALRPLSEITTGLDRIDILSIDVEGMEMQVLQTCDWDKKAKVLVVEHESFNPDNPRESAVYNLLVEKGYELKALCDLSLIFVAK